MSKNTTTITLSCVIVLIAVYAYFSPQITMWSIGNAAKSNDVDTLKGLIGYDSVKGSLAEDIRGQVVASAMKEMPNNPSAGEEMAKANLLIMPVVEAITMPTNLASMITSGKVLDNIIPGKTPDANQASINADAQVDGRYEGYARFHVSARPKSEKEDSAIHFFLKRESIMTWKLDRIVLPAKSTDIFSGVKGKVKPATPPATPPPASTPVPAEQPTVSAPVRKDKSRQTEIEKYLLARLVGKKNQSGENDVQQVVIEVALENKSGKTIKSVDSKLIINDTDGDGRMGIAFSHNQEIAPGSTANYRGIVEVNKNVENDRYVWNTEMGKLRTEFETSVIVFSDGTRMEIH